MEIASLFMSKDCLQCYNDVRKSSLLEEKGQEGKLKQILQKR
jgi:hypothetical protein